MFTNDYVMRQIEMLVWGVARIIGLKQENKLEEAVDLYQDTLRKFFGLTEQSVDKLPWRDLMAVASLGGILDADRCALLAQLIKEKADVDRLRGGDASALMEKALCIYLSAWDADTLVQTREHREKIDELIGSLPGKRLPSDILEPALRFYEQTGRYARAEDVLFELLEGWPDSEHHEMAKAFYLRLLALPDEELARGGLPREEVLDGLHSLEHR